MNRDVVTEPFGPTRWTLVLRAQGETPEARTALGELCEAYYRPVFQFLCREGRPEDAARELAQEFFARILQRGELGAAQRESGRFRSYLLGAVKHFLSDRRDHERRLKRGGGVSPESLDADESGDSEAKHAIQVEDLQARVPDAYFDRQWALAIMDRALQATQEEFESAGKGKQFEELKPWLAGDTDRLSQAEVAARLGWSETAVKVAVHRMRKRFRETVRFEISQTVSDGTDIDVELRYLVEALARESG